jgi:alpha-galactosidase/6-phospho-beta-glucosidase family protein
VDARRNGHCTSLLKRLKEEENLDMTAFVAKEAEAAFHKAGFVQHSLKVMDEQLIDIPDDHIPTVWRSK